MRLRTSWILFALTCVSAAAQAQPVQTSRPPVRPFVERGFVTMNAGAQGAAAELTDHVLFDVNAETGTIDARYPGRTGLLLEGGAGFRVRGRLGIALAVSSATRSGDSSVVAEIPHPFFDDRHRTVQANAGGISRTETAAHLQLYYDVRPRAGWRLRLFAGPSYFNVDQEIVTQVQAEEAFPFDTAEFRSAMTAHAKGSGPGFNAGVDLSRMFTRRIGLGALIQYAGASVDLNAPGSRTVSTDGGGMKAAGGIRILL